MKKTIYVLMLLVLASCASTDTANDGARVQEPRCVPLEDEDVRVFLYQSRKYWSASSEHLSSNYRAGMISERAMQDFAVQSREFAKYYDNALMLYLRGTASADCSRSLITVKKLVLGIADSHPDLEVDINRVRALDDDCAYIQPLGEGPVRELLYKAKSYWDEFSAQMVSLQIRSGGYGDAFVEFRLLNEEFQTLYEEALMLYLGGDSSSERLGTSLDRIKGLLEQARACGAGFQQ